MEGERGDGLRRDGGWKDGMDGRTDRRMEGERGSEGVRKRKRDGVREWERGKVGYFIGKIEAILSQFRQAKGKQRWLRFKFNLYAKWWADVILGRVHRPPTFFAHQTLHFDFSHIITTRGARRGPGTPRGGGGRGAK